MGWKVLSQAEALEIQKRMGEREAIAQVVQEITTLCRVLVAEDAMTERASTVLGVWVDEKMTIAFAQQAEDKRVMRGEEPS